jgi:hypothetical protein
VKYSTFIVLILLATGLIKANETVLATYDGGKLTETEMRIHWNTRGLLEGDLEVLLAANESENEEDQAQHIIEIHNAVLADYFGDQWAKGSVDLSASDRQSVLHQIWKKYRQTWVDKARSELPEPLDVELQGFRDEVLTAAEGNEVRTANVIMLPKPDKDSADAALELANDLMQQVQDGTDFGELASTHSIGPGKYTNGLIGPQKREDIRLTELADLIFEEEVEDELRIIEGESAVFLLDVLTAANGPNSIPDEKLNEVALNMWQRERLNAQMEAQFQEWRRELVSGGVVTGDLESTPLLKVGDYTYSREAFAEVVPSFGRSNGKFAQKSELDNIILGEVFAAKLPEIAPEQPIEEMIRLRMGLRLSNDWQHQEGLKFAEIPEEELIAYFEQAQENKTYKTVYVAKIAFVRVMPTDITNKDLTPEVIERWNKHQDEAARVVRELEGHTGSWDDLKAKVKELNTASDFVIQAKNLGRVSQQPTYMGSEFFSINPGEISTIQTPRSDVSLFYVCLTKEDAELLEYEKARFQVKRALESKARKAKLDEAVSEFLKQIDFKIQ